MTHRIALLALSISVSGCAATPEITLGNPISSGTVGENRIVRHNPYIEQQTNVAPGTYDDDARLTALDTKRACFDVTMHVPARALLDFGKVNATLSAWPGKIELDQAKVSVRESSTRGVAGTENVKVQNGEQAVCYNRNTDGSCRSTYNEATYATVQVATTYQVREQAARFCFSHDGAINATTTTLSLSLAQSGHRVGKFVWALR
jgi:hypothetical protein